jgi:hypothetical protein
MPSNNLKVDPKTKKINRKPKNFWMSDLPSQIILSLKHNQFRLLLSNGTRRHQNQSF